MDLNVGRCRISMHPSHDMTLFQWYRFRKDTKIRKHVVCTCLIKAPSMRINRNPPPTPPPFEYPPQLLSSLPPHFPFLPLLLYPPLHPPPLLLCSFFLFSLLLFSFLFHLQLVTLNMRSHLWECCIVVSRQ